MRARVRRREMPTGLADDGVTSLRQSPTVVRDDGDVDHSPDARQASLTRTVTEIERHVARRGWDAPVAVFALVHTSGALARDPRLAEDLPVSVVASARGDAEHLTSVEQDGLPPAGSLEELLATLAWPATVDGAALVVERVVVPPEAEAAMPADPREALAFLEAHPGREDIRIAAGVLRSGESWCAVRVRSHDDDAAVAGSPDAVPGLVEALRATLA